MKFSNLIKIDQIQLNLEASSKKKVLEAISEIVTENYPEYSTHKVFETLIERERLGSTGLGEGVAIPHCRIQAPQMRAAFVSLAEPIDYEASDGEPVDLLFVLAVPEDEQHAHLQALAALAGVFSDPDNRTALRNCSSDELLRTTLCSQLAQQVPDAKSA